jgi:hypothetical protein
MTDSGFTISALVTIMFHHPIAISTSLHESIELIWIPSEICSSEIVSTIVSNYLVSNSLHFYLFKFLTSSCISCILNTLILFFDQQMFFPMLTLASFPFRQTDPAKFMSTIAGHMIAATTDLNYVIAWWAILPVFFCHNSH